MFVCKTANIIFKNLLCNNKHVPSQRLQTYESLLLRLRKIFTVMSELIHQISYIHRAALPINSYGYQFANTVHFERHFEIQKHLNQLSDITNPNIVTQIFKQSPVTTDLNMQQIFVHPY